MHGFPVLLALTVLFYVVRAIFRAFQSLVRWVRRSSAPRPVEQKTEPRPSDKRPIRQSRLEAQTRRPDAGGPVTTGSPTRQEFPQEFQTQIARIENTQTAGSKPLSDFNDTMNVLSATPGLLTGPDDLLRAVIFQEVLAKPLSQRRRRPSSALDTPPPPQ